MTLIKSVRFKTSSILPQPERSPILAKSGVNARQIKNNNHLHPCLTKRLNEETPLKVVIDGYGTKSVNSESLAPKLKQKSEWVQLVVLAAPLVPLYILNFTLVQ